MNADIITIGDEILIGQVVDTNSTWLAQQFRDYGVKVRQILSISDNADAIIQAIEQSKANIVIITGGLGPTNDDITKSTLAQYFQTDLVFNKKVYKQIEQLFRSMGSPVNALNKQQAMLPENARILPNDNGTAAGMWFTKNNQHFISLPGVPFEMKAIVSDYLLPELFTHFGLKPLRFITIMTVGVSESVLAERLCNWEQALPNYIELAYLPRPGIVRLRLSILQDVFESKKHEITSIINKLKGILPVEIFSFNDTEMEQEVASLLVKLGGSVATAESCTGGSIAAKLTSISGSSKYFKGSVVAYSNSVKKSVLQVNESDINNYGAVSEAVVRQMAKNVRSILKSDYGIATSGIAGPNGGTEQKPVGTTWIAVASKDKVLAKSFSLGNHRGRNIEKASIYALNMLRILLLNEL